MFFVNQFMLIGLVAVSVPILIHLLNRSRARVVDWGAMRFLLASLASRSRRILIEEIVLMALRCLAIALAVFALARPRLASRPTALAMLFVPAVVAASLCAAMAAAMWAEKRLRRIFLFVTILLLALPVVAGGIERAYQSSRWSFGAGEKDVAIILDGSTSMQLTWQGKTNFERAVSEARSVVASCQPADGVSLILAGPTPRAVIGAPATDRKEIAAALDGLRPLGGSMRVVQALQMASHVLGQGGNPAKKIILITDGQLTGWDVRTEARWKFLATSLAGHQTQPHVIVRTLELPESFTNAAVTHIRLARRVLGTDRQVRIDVKVEAAGTEPVEPRPVKLLIDGEDIGTRSTGRILPNAAETVHFKFRFDRPGRHILTARIEGEDDLPGDDTAERVVDVLRALPVLIVDGSPSIRPLEGAADFIDIALAPPAGNGGDGDGGKARRDDRTGCLVVPKVVAAPDIAEIKDLGGYAMVVLADVPLLPKAFAEKVERFVHAGGGLLVAPGAEAQPKFYNAWASRAGPLVLPGKLLKLRSAGQKPARLALESFSHPALEKVADEDVSDARSALIASYWQVEADETDRDVAVGGQLDNGEPVVLERKLGEGVVVLCATALHPRHNNLAALKCFVPLMHELAYYLAGSAMVDCNVESGSDLTLELRAAGGAGEEYGNGLKGEYFNGHGLDAKSLKLTRADPDIDFNWGAKPPHASVKADNFAVRWTGKIKPRFSEAYTFQTDSDDGVRLWVNGKKVLDSWTAKGMHRREGKADLKANRSVPIRLEYRDGTGEASVKLSWSSRGQRKEVVPMSRLYSDAIEATGTLAVGDELEVVTPSQRRRPAKVTDPGEPVRVAFHETHQPGLYRLLLPQGISAKYAAMSPDGKGVPFVVLDRGDESKMTLLTDADLQTAREHMLASMKDADATKLLARVEATNELTASVAGGIPGRPLWRLIAIVLLLALLAEIGLTRWIAIQRKALTIRPVAFGAETVDVQTFRTRAKQMLESPGEQAQPAGKEA